MFFAFFVLSHETNFTRTFFRMQICQTRAWMLSTGFTLAYGAMFSKVWRVHRFTTKQKQDPKVRSSKMCCLSTIEWMLKAPSSNEYLLFSSACVFFLFSLYLFFFSISFAQHFQHTTLEFLVHRIETSRALEIVRFALKHLLWKKNHLQINLFH